jgi:hypothetical protein
MTSLTGQPPAAPIPIDDAQEATLPKITPNDLRSRKWFNNPENPEMMALYLERYLNYGLTRHELQSGIPIIAIAQTGSDLSPCNRHHIELAKRVRNGIIASGGGTARNACAPDPGNWQTPYSDVGSQPCLSWACGNLVWLSCRRRRFDHRL